MGRPVVLPACNLADDLTDGENALLLRRGDALEIAASVERLLDEPGLADRLGARRPAVRDRAAELASERGGARGLLSSPPRLDAVPTAA